MSFSRPTLKLQVLALAGLVLIVGVTARLLPDDDRKSWSDAELHLLQSLSVTALPAPPDDPTNRFADDPRARALGHRLFFDPRLSATGEVACSSCHRPELYFTDGLPRSIGVGHTDRNAMTVVGAAYSPFLFWDGRKDSLWSQALAPFESAAEHGLNRMRLVRLVAEDRQYGLAYETLFGALPDFRDTTRFPQDAAPVGRPEVEAAWLSMAEADRSLVTRTFVNLGKALAAYQRVLLPGPSRFDRYLDDLAAGRISEMLTQTEQTGLALFIGEAGCVDCHNGPLLSNNSFHNTGSLPGPGQLPSKGHSDGQTALLQDPFNCAGPYSDAPGACPELEFLRRGDELMGTHRTPSLRSVARTAPYMHAGQLATLSEVLLQYNEAPAALVGHNEAKPLGLSKRELEALEAFLHSLDGELATPARWLAPPPEPANR